MLKYALLGAAMAISAPALAQVQTAPAAPGRTQVPAPAPAADATVAADVTATAPATDATATAEVATAAPAAQPAPAEQVAQVVDQQFATYDKDANGKLNETEFGAWMVALKAQTDPKTDANAPATKQWNKAAFAQADTDKSKSLDKSELAGFLAPAKS